MSKRGLIVILAMATLFLGALPAVKAGGPGWQPVPGYGPGPWGAEVGSLPDLTPEQREKLTQLRAEFLNDIARLRGQIAVKWTELQALRANPDTDSEQIAAKQREILQLRTQIAERRISHQAKIRALLTKEQLRQLAAYGRGFGRERRGWHRSHLGAGPRW